MKKFGTALALLLAISISVFLAASAEARIRGGGWGMNSRYGRMYNPQTVETLSGEVVKIDRIIPMRGMSQGIHLVLKTDSGEVPVHLGPEWYINKQKPAITEGDRIEVKGSKVTFRGEPVLIAAEVRKGDEVLRLRDDKGNPAWAGWRRGR